MESKLIIPDYVNRATDNRPKPLTRELLLSFLRGSDVKMGCEIIRQRKPNAEAYKRMLPAVAWQSAFDGKLRTDANAQPTGLFCLDIDIHHEDTFKLLLKEKGVEEAYAWAENEARQRAQRWASWMLSQNEKPQSCGQDLRIVGIHVSPSGTGVHVISGWYDNCKTIEENQAQLAASLQTSYDPVCKDWARIFFLTPEEDWTYLDLDSIFGEQEK